jgi:hypothetical protein
VEASLGILKRSHPIHLHLHENGHVALFYEALSIRILTMIASKRIYVTAGACCNCRMQPEVHLPCWGQVMEDYGYYGQSKAFQFYDSFDSNRGVEITYEASVCIRGRISTHSSRLQTGPPNDDPPYRKGSPPFLHLEGESCGQRTPPLCRRFSK